MVHAAGAALVSTPRTNHAARGSDVSRFEIIATDHGDGDRWHEKYPNPGSASR